MYAIVLKVGTREAPRGDTGDEDIAAAISAWFVGRKLKLPMSCTKKALL